MRMMYAVQAALIPKRLCHLISLRPIESQNSVRRSRTNASVVQLN